MPRALVIGASGQDGTLLSALLRERDYALTLVSRTSHDVTQADEVATLLESEPPDEIYYLAAHHHSAEAIREPGDDLVGASIRTNTLALGNVLSAMVRLESTATIFYASSAHIFEGSDVRALDEQEPLRPDSIYAISKVAGMHLCRYYRRHFGVQASCGILFNHESIYRPAEFLSRKIAKAAAAISRAGTGSLTLGNLEAVADWGAAEDYVEAMWRIAQVKEADDFVVATGVPHSVRDFVDLAFRHVGLDYSKYVQVDPLVVARPSPRRIGNPGKLAHVTGWTAAIPFERMVVNLVDHELSVV